MTDYREATAADTPALISLLAEIMAHHGVHPPEATRLSQVVEHVLASPGHTFLVADTGQGLIGMCALVFTYSTWSAAPVCELQDVIVKQEYRRAQVGRRLAQAAEDLARSRGCARLFLLAEYWNLEAHSFYRSLDLAEKTCLYFERDLSSG